MKKLSKIFFNKIKKIKPKTWKILGVVLVIIFVFFWSQMRPIFAKRNCFNKATERAIEIKRDEKAESYLYDRVHWRNYKKYPPLNINYESSFEAQLDQIFNPINGTPTFPVNLSTGIEPTYIQENLDRITKENDFNKDDYDIYYKMCLQSKGL